MEVIILDESDAVAELGVQCVHEFIKKIRMLFEAISYINNQSLQQDLKTLRCF